MGRLDGRVAIVTGGGSGIGACFCEALGREGAAVVVAEIDPSGAQRTAETVTGAGGRAMAAVTDVSKLASIQATVGQAIDTFGRIDILVNNASLVAPVTRPQVDELSEDEWDAFYGVNVRGMFLMCKAVVPHMRKAHYGKIVNMSSSTIFGGGGGRLPYTSGKAAIVGMTRVLARQLGDDNISVNAIAPGYTDSKARRTPAMDMLHEQAAASRAFKRVQVPEDLAGPLLFLVSADSDFVTGQLLVVDGGINFH